MMKGSIFIFNVVSVLLLSVNGYHQWKNSEDLCGSIVDILCVRDVLSNIAAAATKIHEMANTVEHKILKQDPVSDTLIKYIASATSDLRSNYPPVEYHNRLSTEKNNINKHDLIDLIKEQHYAVSYLYNSVRDLRNTKSTLAIDVDDLLNQTQTILQTKMICNYRNILRVYIDNLLPVHHKHGIHLPKSRKREVTSEIRNGYSVIIARLSREWMTNIRNFIDNLENKIM